jgi:hypothetical protein
MIQLKLGPTSTKKYLINHRPGAMHGHFVLVYPYFCSRLRMQRKTIWTRLVIGQPKTNLILNHPIP